MSNVNDQIDRLLHDADHAEGGSKMAVMMGDVANAKFFLQKNIDLIAEAKKLYLANPGSLWPECEIPAPAAEVQE